MDVTRITVEHVRVATDQPFEKATKAFEEQTGRFDPSAYQHLNAGANPEEIRAKIKAMEGPSGFMLFKASDHRALLRLAGQKKKALQYLVQSAFCHPNDRARHSCKLVRPAASADLRERTRRDVRGYDRPSSLFGQFGNPKVTEVARMLDRKLEQLVDKAIQ
jgi:hypothetical protein